MESTEKTSFFQYALTGYSIPVHSTRKQVIDMKIRKHNGLTLIGFLIVLCVVLLFAYAGMRLVPTYLEYNALLNAMDTLKSDPQSKNLSAMALKQRLEANLWVNYATDNIKRENMRISKRSDGVTVRVAYEVRKPFLGNVDLIVSFDHSVVLK